MNTFTEKTMNRKIKFRVWDHQENIFEHDSSFWIYQSGELDHDFKNAKREDYTVQQFTGLKDKNGKEVYEGDVIRVTYKMDELGDTETYVSAVVFEDGAFGDKFDCFFSYSFVPSFEMEILGNIFENPELLKSK
jgi:uncharacterized phage protein (TIGR01671 family)